MNKNIDIIFITEKSLFNNKYTDSLKNLGNIFFYSKENYVSNIISNKNKKIR